MRTTIDKYINDTNILNVYIFGSQLYGTSTDKSDTDLILIVKDMFDSNDIDVHVYTLEQFYMSLNNHDIQTLEVISCKNISCKKETVVINLPKIDKNKLRKSISTICNNSWVKGKKKLIISGDYDKYAALKSIFHSLRILSYGIQLANSGKIFDLTDVNYIYTDLIKLGEMYDRDELWEIIDTKYRKVFNNSSSTFKSLAPKDLTEKNKTILLEKLLLEKLGIIDDELKYGILNIFEL